VGYPEDVRYTATHEWARLENGLVTVGVTSRAAEQLGDIVYVGGERDKIVPGTNVEAAAAYGVIESAKAQSDLFAPVSGEIAEVNEAVLDKPGLINEDPFGAGWIVRLKPSDPAQMDRLMSAADYEKVAEAEH
jgi:glycine cleavage system H protein